MPDWLWRTLLIITCIVGFMLGAIIRPSGIHEPQQDNHTTQLDGGK